MGPRLNRRSSAISQNQHCDLNCSKENGILGVLRRFLGDCTTSVQLEYANSVWNPYTNRNINQAKMVQTFQLCLT